MSALHRAGKLAFFGDLEHLADPAASAAWLSPLRKTEWVVYAKPPFGGPEAVLAYLSRYTHPLPASGLLRKPREGVAISNSRLVSADAETVAFRWKDYRTRRGDRRSVMRLATGEFIRRFLIHVLPPLGGLLRNRLPGRDDFHRIRHYALLASVGRKRDVETIRRLLGATPSASPESTDTDPAPPLTLREPCPDCGGPMRIVETFRRGERPLTCAPPRRAAA